MPTSDGTRGQDRGQPQEQEPGKGTRSRSRSKKQELPVHEGLPTSPVNGPQGGKQGKGGQGRKLPPPLVQLETQGTAPPPGSGQGDAGKPEEPKRKTLLQQIFGQQRKPEGAQFDEVFAPGARFASPDELRQLPPSFRRTAVVEDVDANREFLREAFGGSWDIVFRDLTLGREDLKGLIVYVDGLVDKEAIQRFAILTLTLESRKTGAVEEAPRGTLLDELQNKIIAFGEVRLSADLAEISDRLTSGETALFIAGETAAIIMDTRGWKGRGVEEPSTEVTVRGPREGFTETLKTNTALLRRRLKTPLLRLERAMAGDYTRTDIVVAYIDGVANTEVVKEVRRRLNRIAIDGVLESQYVEELIQDDPWTFFPLVRATEYPDRLASGLLEGKVAILFDTTPFALLVPTTLVSLLHASEDHFSKPTAATAIRLVRFLCLFIALFGSAVYVAATTFHPEILPMQLLERLVIAKRGVPFGSAVEALILEVSFEILREAGVRLPRPVGQAVSIVGALVLGEAAVSAGVVSPAIVIVVALSAICSLALPSYFLSIGMRLLRFPLLLLGATLGAFGLAIGTLFLAAHLAAQSSFGVPYLSGVAPFSLDQWRRDVIVRAPRWAMNSRPAGMGPQYPRRAAPNLRPGPDQPNAPSQADGDSSGGKGGHTG